MNYSFLCIVYATKEKVLIRAGMTCIKLVIILTLYNGPRGLTASYIVYYSLRAGYIRAACNQLGNKN